MTLEDFFTLTEMKDGLTVPARVKELVNVMHKEKDSIEKSISDMTRQWSTVASTIIATEDKDCLELFIQLDGLCFIDRWLNDAQRFSLETSCNFVEESITSLLRALEKLQVGYERSSACGILLTIENLLNHGSSKVQDGAKVLFNQWKKNDDVNEVSVEHEADKRMPVISADDMEKERVEDDKGKILEDDKHSDFTGIETIAVADSIEKESDSLTPTPVVFDQVIEESSKPPIPNDCSDDDDKQELPMKSSPNGPSAADDQMDMENGNATLDNGEVDELEDDDDDDSKEMAINLNLLKPAIICKVPNSIDEKRCDIELDYSIVDALEVARQVAIEVEREVGDHKEPTCSNSSEKKKSIVPDKHEPSSTSSSSRSRNSRETPNQKTENSSQLTVSSTEIEANSTPKGHMELDLNQEVSSEDMDQPEKPIPTHISQVSASRAAAVSELASSPLQHEAGWKGSATTSAFRRVSDGIDKVSLDFDLNVADHEDNNNTDTDMTNSNSRPMLDLNIMSDHSESPPDLNIDLNMDDNPYSGPTPTTFQSISLMGTKVEIGQREILTTPPPRTLFSMRPNLQYSQMAHTVGPTLPFSLSPYMVDPRGGHGYGHGQGQGQVLPQSHFFMMGPGPTSGHYTGAGAGSSSSNHHHLHHQQQPQHRIFDLNMEGGKRESVGFRQFLSMGNQNNSPMEEQLRNSQMPSSSSSSGYGIGKRKEAEGGWDGYPYSNLKRPNPPWK